MARRGVVSKKLLKDKDERPVRLRRYPCLFLIVCEDENTEPYYFESFVKLFPDETVFLRTIGTGKSAKGVVEQCIIEKNKLHEESRKNIDFTWVVFDKDDADLVPANALRFHDAFTIARENDIHIAYSNEAFELWLLLHFESVESATPISRKQIYKALERCIREFNGHDTFVYKHGNTNIIDAVEAIGTESDAIARAERILGEHNARSAQPIEANPSTTVHKLVKKLRALIEWYSEDPY